MPNILSRTTNISFQQTKLYLKNSFKIFNSNHCFIMWQPQAINIKYPINKKVKKNRVTKVYDPSLIKRKMIACFFLMFETTYQNYIIAVDLMENRIFEQDLNVWRPNHPRQWRRVRYFKFEDFKLPKPISTQHHKFLRLYAFRFSWMLRFLWSGSKVNITMS